MEHNKRILIILVGFFLFILSIIFLPRLSLLKAQQTQTQTKEQLTCYHQCSTYLFFWQGDFCYDLFANTCTEKVSVKDAITLIKNLYNLLKKNKLAMWFDVDKVFKAWFVCKPLIEDCIVPQLNNCRQICQSDPKYFAPDLSVGHPDSRFRGVVYNEKQNKLYFKVVNNGFAYAWDIDVEASYGHTTDRNGHIPSNNSRQLFKEKIEHLIYLGARNGPPKTPGDYIGDFLIDEALAGKYLHDFKSWMLKDFKSDSKNYSVPNFWIKEMPFTPIKGELNQVILNVDSSQYIDELYENNNTFILNIDLRPTPSQFSLENFSYQLVEQTLNDFLINFKIKNNGDESGKVIIKIHEDNEQSPHIFQTEPVITGKDIAGGSYSIDTIVHIDTTKETSFYCGRLKKYILTIVNQETNEKIKREFYLPIYVGDVWGRVVDLHNRPVAGATIRSSTGQETQTNNSGSYNLIGINTLGKIVITASHPEFSQETKKEVEIKIDNPYKVCDEGKTRFFGVDFLLKDIDVLFKITVKDKKTNQPINAHLLATNKEGFRLEHDVSNQTALPGLQPGNYFFTISSPGYKTIGQTVNAVPQDLELEFFMEKLNGRPYDAGLTIQQPQLLWEKNLNEEILVDMRMTKDGKTVIFYTSRNHPGTGKLFFLEGISGSSKKVVGTIANGGQSQASIDTSYDGNTTSLCTNDDKTFGKDRGKNWIKIFDSLGNSLGQMNYNPMNTTHVCEVSPDGFYLYPYFLINKGFYQYTRYDTEGSMNYYKPSEKKVSFGSYQGTHFTTNNKVLGLGNRECDLALKNFNHTPVYCYRETNLSPPVFTDSSQDGQKITTIGIKKVYYFAADKKKWDKNVETHGRFLSVGMTPGGNYVIYSTHSSGIPYRQIKIFTDNNIDKTPSQSQKGREEDVIYVAANDKGIFYAALKGKKLRFYQVGKYQTEYQGETYPTPTKPVLTSGISIFRNGQLEGLSPLLFSDLIVGLIYYANQSVSFNLNNLGTIRLTQGTVFSVNYQGNPILLKGQITADFNSPVKIFAIKFNRYDLALFERKLNLLINNQLPDEEIFEIKNIHTKFIITNEKNKINVAVSSGKVQITGKNLDQSIKSGKQIEIDDKNKIKESVYLGTNFYLLITAFLTAVFGILLFKYKSTPVGKKVLKFLKTLIIFLKKITVKLFRLTLWIIKKVIPIVWTIAKNIAHKLAKMFKKNLTSDTRRVTEF